MKKIIATFIFIVISDFSFSQDTLNTAEMARWSVTVRPMGFVDPFLTNFTGGVQYRIHDKILVELQGGLIKNWFCINNNNEEDIQKDGFKVAVDVKYLAFKKLYFAAQFFRNDYTKTNREEVWWYNQSYRQDMELNKTIVATGGHLKVGFLLHKPERKLFFDFYGGVGYRFRQITIPNLPEGAEIINTSNGFLEIDKDETGSRNYISLSLGVAVGLKLGR